MDTARSIEQPTSGNPPCDLVQRATPLRFAGYTAALAALMFSLPAMQVAYGDQAFTDGGPLESIQLGLIALTGLLLVGCAVARPSQRGPLWLLAGCAAFASMRELDGTLDALLPVGGWPLLAFGSAGIFALLAWRARGTFADAAPRLLHGTAFPLMWAGMVCVVLIAQLAGHKGVLDPLLGECSPRLARRYIEEVIEAFGYALLFFGCIELLLSRPASTADASRADFVAR